MNVFKKNYGITLIALVITIIVILILAGVAISMLAGENGILRQAAKAKTKTEDASMDETIKLAVLTARTEGLGKIDYNILNEELAKLGFDRGEKDDNGIYSNDVAGLPAMINLNGKDYTITSDGAALSGKWKYKEDKRGRKTIVTNGIIELPIGTYINYNAAATDADEKNIVEKSAYVSDGSPKMDTQNAYYKAAEETIGRGTGQSATLKNSVETNGWRVLGVDEDKGELLIITSGTVATSNYGGYLTVGGVQSYVYGEKELDKLCGILGQGFGATGGRSIKVEDINKITGYNPNNIGKYDPNLEETGKKYGEGSIYEYGNKVKYYWQGTEYPYYEGSNGIEGALTYAHDHNAFNWCDGTEWKCSEKSENASVESKEKIGEATGTYYRYNVNSLDESNSGTSEGIDISSDEYSVLFKDINGNNISYWLSSTYVYNNTYYISYGIRSAGGGNVSGTMVYHSNGNAYKSFSKIRAVVSLKSNIKLEYDENNKYYDIID